MDESDLYLNKAQYYELLWYNKYKKFPNVQNPDSAHSICCHVLLYNKWPGHTISLLSPFLPFHSDWPKYNRLSAGVIRVKVRQA